ncbi:MAG: lactate racemase domain-containing protein [Planctomycetaceae bacterium]|jgi:nickel-dependent lactate racemase|nr:lactate racemase domain-containing protein [Planctomycetaceae bacterium]
MKLIENRQTAKTINDTEVRRIFEEAIQHGDLAGRKVLVLIPDSTRTCPLPMMFRQMVETFRPHVAKLDFLIALGTHQPMPEDAIDQLLGRTQEIKTGLFADVEVLNHNWSDPENFAKLGTLSPEQIAEATGGLMNQPVDVGINRKVLDYDVTIILGPTYPHEVVGFSGGLKYFFPGISNFKFIDFFHWLGAVITCLKVIGIKDTPVRRVINEAAKLIPKRILSANMVVEEGTLIGLFFGDPLEAWSKAADLSDKVHIVYKEKPYKLVIGLAPEMYDELWTAGKVMYKLEPIVADGGELVIYAPHVKEVSFTHGENIKKVGYHVRDYFLKQWEKFAGMPGGVLAHSTHVRGIGTFEDGIEKPRITVTLATGIPPETTRQINLNWRDWRSMEVDSFRHREDEGILVVDHAGEVLHRLKP